MLKTRVLTAAVLIPLTLAALFLLEPRGWGALTLLVVAIAATEWANLAGYPQRAWPLFAAVIFLSGFGLLFAPGSGFSPGSGWPEVVPLAFCGLATLFWLLAAPAWLAAGRSAPSRLALALLGWLLLIATWVAVVQLQARSPWLLLALMAVVWIADTAAYFAGRAFGRRKLAPSISPGKTWEGAFGALIATGVYALLLLYFAPEGGYRGSLSALAVIVWVAAILALTALSIVGDLFESFLKRQRGVKDSGRLLPGHGGVLDRIDALLAAMPAAALIAQYALR
jgi:phosphatidate cytidylyltransferase